MRYGCHFENGEEEEEEEKEMNESDNNVVDHDDNKQSEEEKKEDSNQLKELKYAGSKEDGEWIASTNTIRIENEQRIYERLISKMGVFRWQGSQLSMIMIH